MAKNILYRYNPETDNFERAYPSVGSRVLRWIKTGGVAFILAALMFAVVFYCLDSPTEENLRIENRQLRTQFNILNRRMDNSLKVLEHIRERDDNFYRVMMQIEPMGASQRLAGLDNESRYRELEDLSDADLVRQLSRRMDLIERQLLAQVQSFDQLRDAISREKEKMTHIPTIMPVDKRLFTIACGFGYRRDPISGHSKFHEGIDITAAKGTPVLATADGKVATAERKAGYGNYIEIDHGYNYSSRYAHLSELTVKQGDMVKRGQIIGRVGSSGISTGSHLHYEVRYKDESQNPINYLYMDINPEEYEDFTRKGENAGHLMD